MARKLVIAAALALVALTSTISIGIAQAHWAHWGYYGWGYPGWAYRPWWSGYYGFYRPYSGPVCYVTAFGTTACY
jgi:hypothetical protein